jgi:hypothetical protein
LAGNRTEEYREFHAMLTSRTAFSSLEISMVYSRAAMKEREREREREEEWTSDRG